MSEADLAELLDEGGRPLGPALTDPEVVSLIPEPLRPLLLKKNGFYAFGPALYVRPWNPKLPGNCLWWNAVDTWRYEFQGVGDDLLFFAEDVFGFQFAIHPQGFYQFNSETAEREFMGNDVYEWAAKLMSDFDFYTGMSVAKEWQERNGMLPVGSRLAAPTPFFLGGEFAAEGLNAIPDVELMRFRGDVYTQTKDLPEGATINFEVQ